MEKVRTLKPINTRRTDEPLSLHEDDSHHSNGEALSPVSSMFLDPKFDTHIIVIFGSSTPINVEVFKQNLPETLLRHPRFSSIVVKGPSNKRELKWVRKEEIDLDYHIIVPAVNSTIIHGSKMVDKFLEDYIYDLSKTRLDKSRPLWDLHILNIKTSEEKGFVILRAHHSLGDGVSLISLLLACTRKVSDLKAPPTMPMSTKKIKGDEYGIKSNFGSDGDTKFYWQGCRRVLVLLWGFFEIIWNTWVDLLMLSLTLCFLKDKNTLLKGNDEAGSAPMRVVYTTVCLDDMKLVKNAMDATVTDVALGMTQAGISRHLNRMQAHDVKIDNEATKKMFKLAKKTRMRSALIVNIRPSPSIKELTNMMETRTYYKWGNRVGLALIPFNIDSKDDPLDHVREAKASVDKKKRSFGATTTFLFIKFLAKLFGNKVAAALGKRVIRSTTLAFSSVVGPTDEICFYGHQISLLAPTGYGFPHGLYIHFMSYANRMTIVVTADENTIHDPHQLSEDIVESLKIMKEAILSKSY